MSSFASQASPLSPPAQRSPFLAPQKGVTIFHEPDQIESKPGDQEDFPSPTLVGSYSPRIHRASISGRKLTGRPPPCQTNATSNLSQQFPLLSLDSSNSVEAAGDENAFDPKALLAEVVDWLNEEKAKRYRRRLQDYHIGKHRDATENVATEVGGTPSDRGDGDQDTSLERLEKILAGFAAATKQKMPKLTHRSSTTLNRKRSIAKKFKKYSTSSKAPQSSDTEFFGDDMLVPNVEAALDNSKTLAYCGGSADPDTNESAKRKDQQAWITFKEDIVRLTHTLKLKGWRRVSIEKSAEIDVSRLSGALTNAVYVVKPPKNLADEKTSGQLTPAPPKSQPMMLLLRIYGPQVEHLIDRDSELAILRRLARKRIGPRLLGSFSNGRFEEFLHATTLVAEDLRQPETSKQIAKRMRELHDGIELLESELDAGAAVFVKWDKWVGRCEKVITWLDNLIHESGNSKLTPALNRYTRRGFVCGVEWPVFRQAFDRYRERLLQECGGPKGLREKLVFAHNDTQYGNLMRVQPSGESPLLQPANQHRQLVVIDFEYAGQNTIGIEFANHFTEWCYNYHHPELSFACNTNAYPTKEEQYRFVRSYVMHRPQFNPAASATPKMEAREKTYISDFMLDARTPAGGNSIDYDAEESAREKAMEADIQQLLHETRLWRIANSAQWVAWGIVQAKVPELDEPPEKSRTAALIDKVKGKMHPQSDPLDEEEQQLAEAAKHDRPDGRELEEAHAEGNDEDEEFDCLAYAQERAMFFWGDCLQMGIITEDELPEATRKMVKTIKY